jgi:tRNA(Ile)-lysidine synthase
VFLQTLRVGVTRSHPPTLLTQVARTLREECGIVGRASVLVAVSGGPDSMALLHALSWLRSEFGLQLSACGVDHGLRPAAEAELRLASELCAALGVPFSKKRVELDSGGNLQARARAVRYEALAEAQRETGAEFLATAHHLQDRAETVLLRLLRGAGPAGLAVLPARQGNLLRPLIRVSKSAVLSHLAQHAVASANDPSNRDPRFLRTRVRTELVPLLEQLSPGIIGHLTALADELGEPPLPPIYDDKGEAIRLNRAQRSELRRALNERTMSARIWLSGGRFIRLDPASGLPVLGRSAPSTGAEPAERVRKPC